METPIKAFGYTRVSGRGQIEGDGPERQRLSIQKYATKNNIDIVGFFEEKAIPGTTPWAERPAWMDMVSSLNGTSTIIVEGLDRLARELGLQEFILSDLTRRGVTLLSTREDDVQNPDPSRILFRQMMGGFHQFEKSMIVLKLRGARQRFKAKNGKCEGRKLYGENPDKPEEVALRERITTLSTTHSHSQIASMLNTEGIKSSTGKVWYPNVVARIAARR